MHGYGLIAYSHFYRSQEAAFNNKRKQPNFNEFISHWLHSDKSFIPELIFREFSKIYNKPPNIKIEKGNSYWG